jgi:MYG1 exonuclease
MLKVIGTHNGTFHCDEALAVYMLRLTETYRNAGCLFHTERYMAFH